VFFNNPPPPNTHTQDLYRISRQLASVVVPHEYGLDEQGKLLIGSKICAELLGKLLVDLESMKVRMHWYSRGLPACSCVVACGCCAACGCAHINFEDCHYLGCA
jgi:hypothetical protein